MTTSDGDSGPIVSERRHTIEGYHLSAELMIINPIGLRHAAHSTFLALGWAIGDLRRRRTLRGLLGRADGPVPLGRAPEGLVRIEGRVAGLDLVPTPDGEPAAAYRVHEAREEPCECMDGCTAILRIVRAERHAGRFLVRDATGVALVEPGAIVLCDYRGNTLDPGASGALVVRDGDPVTIVGAARRKSAGNLESVSFEGFREAQLPLVFEGTPEAPVYVFGPGEDPRTMP
jgi:hypothetical protein